MKIALCLSGQPRFYKRGFDYINKYIIEPNNIDDIFCHFWFNENDVGKVGYTNTSRTLKNEGYDGDVIDSEIPNNIKLLYNPKSMLHENQYDCNNFIKRNYDIVDLTNPFAVYSQYLSTHRCIELKNRYEYENNITYDVIIKCRYDILLDSEVFISNTDEIIFHNDVNHCEKVVVNDGFYYGDNKLMTKMISESYLNFDDYSLDSSIIWNNHYLLGKYLDYSGIKYKKMNLGNIKWIRRL